MAGRLFNPNIEHPLDANTTALEASAAMRRAARRALATFRINPIERIELLTLLGLKGATERLVASNSRLRIHSTKTLVDMFSRLVKAGAKVADRRYWHVSFLGPLINEYRPELDVDAYRQVIDRLLRPYPLNAVFSIELQALTNYPQKGCERSFLLNAHALAWTDDPTFDPAKAENEMSARPVLRNEFDAKNVTFTPRDDTDEVPFLGYYLTKLPILGKLLERVPGNTSRRHLLPVGTVRDDLLLRLLELLSRLEVTDLVWGVKEGRKIRSAWKAELVQWYLRRCGGAGTALDADFDAGELWQRVRARSRNGSRHYRPPLFYGPRPRPLPSETLPKLQGKRIWPDRYDVRFDLPEKPAVGADSLRELDDIDRHPDPKLDGFDKLFSGDSKAIARLKLMHKRSSRISSDHKNRPV